MTKIQIQNALATADEICAFLRISRPTLRRLMADGLPYKRVGPRLQRFDLAEVQAWSAQRKA